MKTIPQLLFVTLSLAACGGDAADNQSAQAAVPEAVTGYVVTADSVWATAAVQGTVQARQRAEISTRTMARVTEVAVDLGSTVHAGQVLIRLGLDDVEASRAKAEAALTMAVAARDEAARHAARMDTLVAEDAVPRVQGDQARLALTQAESQLAVAEATLREVESAASYARIEAPFAGVVVSRTVDAGDVASPGVPLLVVESTGARDAVLAVAPDVAEALHEGGSVEVTNRDGRATSARVRAVAGGADPSTRTVEVRVELPADWATGGSVTALLPVGRRVAVTIPLEAIVRRGQLTGVHVLQGDATALRWVRLGRETAGRVEVLSGLEAGERIAR